MTIILSILSVAVIQFGQSEYVVEEEQRAVTVCLTIINSILERSVSISLSTLENSAAGLFNTQ